MKEFDAALRGDALHRDVQRAADARRAIGDLARIRLRVVEELLPGLPGAVRLHHHAEQVARQVDDVGEVAHRVPGRAARHHGVAEGGDRQLAHQVAVASLFRRHDLRGHGAGGAAAVLDDHRLAEMPRRDFRERAQLAVGRPAGRPGHDQADGTVRKALLRDGGGCEQRPGGAEQRAAVEHVSWSSRFEVLAAPRGLARGRGAAQGRSFDMMTVPEAENIPPTPWHTLTFTSGTCAGAMPRTWRTLSCRANMPYMPVWV